MLTLSRDPRVEEVLAPGVGRVGTTLHLLEATQSAGQSWEQLPSEKGYEGSDIAALVTEILPEVAKQFALTVNAASLPEVDRTLRPREVLHVEQVGEVLSVRPEIVYGDPATCRIDNGRLVYLNGALPVRNEAAEHKVAERVKARLGLNIGRRITVSGTQATELAVRLDRFDGEIVGRRRDAFIWPEALQPQVDPSRGFTASLTFQARAADGTTLNASAEAVLQAWHQGQPLVPLLDGGWAPLPTSWLQQYGTLLDRVFALRDKDGQPQSAVKPALVELYAALNTPAPSDLEPLRQLLMDPSSLAHPTLPSDLTATLRPYQLDGVRWLSILRRSQIGATLADDMGLGKTLQVICNLEGRCLVVAPTSLVFNWADEIAKFRPDLRVNIYHGKGRELTTGDGVTLTSYALLRLDLDVLQAQHWDIVVLDEAQAIKNPESQVAQAAYALQGKFRVTVTGTPVENRLEELWSQFHFTNPGLLGGREAFQTSLRRYHEQPGSTYVTAASDRTVHLATRQAQRGERPTSAFGFGLALRLRRTRTHALRRTHAQHAARGCRPTCERRKCHESARSAVAITTSGMPPGARTGTDRSFLFKIERLCTALEECIADGHKALVFSQWTGFWIWSSRTWSNAAFRLGASTAARPTARRW